MSSRTPETLTAAQRAQRLNLKPLTPPPIDPEPQPISEQEPMIATKTPSKQEQKTIEQARTRQHQACRQHQCHIKAFHHQASCT